MKGVVVDKFVRLVAYPDPGLAEQVQRLADEQNRSTSGMLVKIVQDHFRREPIINLIEARERRLITHQEAVDKFAVLIERNGNE